MARPISDQGLESVTRRVAIGAGFGLAALALAATGAGAEALQTKNTAGPSQQVSVRPATGVEKYCDDIKDVFQLAKFTGSYRQRADTFVAKRCVGAVPFPQRGDDYNGQRFNASARVLRTGGIEISPTN